MAHELRRLGQVSCNANALPEHQRFVPVLCGLLWRHHLHFLKRHCVDCVSPVEKLGVRGAWQSVVTTTPASFTSSVSASENESTKAFVAW